MSTFKEFFKFEWKRFIGKRNLVIFAVLVVLVFVVTQFNVSLYNRKVDQKKILVKFEKKRVEKFFSYRVYGPYGFRIAIKPVPIDIWSFGTVPFLDMQAVVDTSERLKINTPLQGESAFAVKMKWFTDFSGILLLLGGILVFLFGFESYYHGKYLKFLSSFASDRGVFLSVALSRIILVVLLYLVLILFSYLVIALNGIVIPFTWKLPVFFLTAVVTALCFFGLGAWLGQLKKKWAGLVAGGIICFVSIFFIPSVIDMLTLGKAQNMTSIYEMELKKLDILSDFEKRAKEKDGIIKLGEKPNDVRKNLADSYVKNDLKKLLENDQEMIDQMSGSVSLFKKLSMLFPTSNYFSTNYSLSNNGYRSLLAFYRRVKEVKRLFVKSYMDIVFIFEKENEKFEPFLKDEEILFNPERQMTWEIAGGLIISLIFFLVLMAGAWNRYKKLRTQLPEKDEKAVEAEDIDLKAGVVTPVYANDDRFENQIYCLFAGGGEEFVKKGYRHKIMLENKNLEDNTEKLDFLYLPYIKTFPPDVKAGPLLDIVMGLAKTGKDRREKILEKNDIGLLLETKFGDMDADGLGRVFLALLDTRTFKHYIISDITPGKTPEYLLKLRDRVEDLADDDEANVLLITSYPLYRSRTGKQGSYFNKNELFFKLLASYENIDTKNGDPDKPAKNGDGDE